MGFKIIILPSVYNEVSDAFNYYESKSPGLDERFYNDYIDSIARLKNNPLYYSYYHEFYRRISLATFPYMIIYKVKDEETVIVYAVVYEGRNPTYIKEKIYSE